MAFALAGLLLSRALVISLMLSLPVAWAGLWVGNRVHGRLAPAAPAVTARLIGVTLFLSGAALIVRAF